MISRLPKMRFEDDQGGQALLLTIFLVMLIGLAGLLAFTAIALRESASISTNLDAKRVYFLAEGAVEDLAWRIKNQKQYSSGEMVTLGGASANVGVTTVGGERIITARGDISQAIRTVRMTLRSGVGAAFHFGILVGRGGFRIENTARVVGSIYANGNISGQNFPEITGDAFAAASSTITNIPTIGGNVQAYAIDDVSVGGSATATASISDGTIGWNAYAGSVTGSTIGNHLSYCTSQSGNSIASPPAIQSCPAPTELPEVELPISDAQISDWEAAAVLGGTYSGPCPYVLDSGTTTIGPLKIDCDFTIQNTAIVTLEGPIWVVGDFTIENSGIIQLALSYGSGSEVVIADNPTNRTTASKIFVENTAQVLGSGAPASYLMLVSMNNSAENGGSESAIAPKNTADASIYYAPHGRIAIENSTALKEATAYTIHMKNASELTYESGLAGVNFTSGPAGGWEIEAWNEVP